jgi:hypothetical protein
MVEYDTENLIRLYVFENLVNFQQGKAPKSVSALKKKN